MNCLTKPHCKISAHAHNIARSAADATAEPNDRLWQRVYRNVYEAAYNQEVHAVPAWLCVLFVISATAAGYLLGRIQ